MSSLSISPRGKNSTAAWILYVVSVFGILGLFSKSTITGHIESLIFVDLTVYVVLFILAILIHKNISFAKITYPIIAVIWYLVLIFVLSWRYHHQINLYTIFMQIVLTILAVCILYSSDKSKAS